MSLKKYSAFAAGIALACMVQGNALAATDVYLEGAYDVASNTLDVEIYADTDTGLISGGVAVEFDTAEITPPSQSEITNDPATSKASRGPDWKIGDAEYMLPQAAVNGSQGKVSYILGKYDPAETTQTGMQGNKILLGKGKFQYNAAHMPSGTDPFPSVGLKLAYGRTDLTTSEGQYVHFASPAGADLDGSVNIKSVTIREYGDANGDTSINVNDMKALRKLLNSDTPPIYADCNMDGAVNVNDMKCLRKKI